MLDAVTGADAGELVFAANVLIEELAFGEGLAHVLGGRRGDAVIMIDRMHVKNSPGAGLVPAPLKRRALPADPVNLARWLIGKHLVRKLSGATLIGRIVETEAYLADDPASHSFSGRTNRNASMFGVRGCAYVYRIYGMWFCFNVAAASEGEGAAVLIRALEPEIGVDEMSARRGGAGVRDLARGPGRLCAALGIDRALDGLDLCRPNGALWLGSGKAKASIGASRRIGITKAPELELRFYERGNRFVSGPAALRADA